MRWGSCFIEGRNTRNTGDTSRTRAHVRSLRHNTQEYDLRINRPGGPRARATSEDLRYDTLATRTRSLPIVWHGHVTSSFAGRFPPPLRQVRGSVHHLVSPCISHAPSCASVLHGTAMIPWTHGTHPSSSAFTCYAIAHRSPGALMLHGTGGGSAQAFALPRGQRSLLPTPPPHAVCPPCISVWRALCLSPSVQEPGAPQARVSSVRLAARSFARSSMSALRRTSTSIGSSSSPSSCARPMPSKSVE